MPSPLISVVMPVFGTLQYLPAALESIRRQRYEPLELIVVDDGADPELDAILAPYPEAICFHRSHHGYAASLNFGLSQVRGSLITFLDADDWWMDEKLATQTKVLAERETIDIVVGSVQIVRLSKTEDRWEPTPEDRQLFNLGSGLFRRAALERVGGFDEDLMVHSDWDWFLRARELGLQIHLDPTTVLSYRRHAGNLTNRTEAVQQSLLRLLRKTVDRRKALGGRPPTLAELLREQRGR